MSIRLIAYLSAAALAAVVLAYGLGRWQGSAAEKRACEAEIHAAELTAERQARQKEKDMQKKLNGITENYLHEIDEYKKTINAYAANDLDVGRLSGDSVISWLG